jgi:formate hydrogenlyase transcriptional activator
MVATHLIGSSNAFLNVLEDIRMVASAGCSVLIQGETGTGKEVVARAIHSEGVRRYKPFVALNCSAIPAGLIESELFGHEKGAFTGATSQTMGRFLAAHEGTIFLDEIGDLPLELQPKLLRVLQERQFERVGSSRTSRVDVRVIAATNLRLEEMVAEKRFRADLFYRLNVFPLTLPPLRHRKDDIPLLARHFMKVSSNRFGRKVEHIPPAILDRMCDHDWPGNIRELQNFIERSVITSPGDTLSPRTRELELLSGSSLQKLPLTLADAERAHIVKALTETNWVIGGQKGAAARLGLPRTTLISRMQKLRLAKTIQRREGSSSLMPPSLFPGQEGSEFVVN